MTGRPSAKPLLIHRVIARLNVGGPAIHVVNLARALGDGAWRTRLVAGSVPESEGDMSYYATERGVDVTYLPSMSRELDPRGDLAALWELYRLFRRERPDVVHTHTAKAGTLGRVAAVLARVPVRVHTYHGHVLGGDYFGRLKTAVFLWIERVLARMTHRLVVLTELQAEQMAARLRVAPRARFAVIPLGLELERFAAVDRRDARARFRSELGVASDELVLGIVGRMVPIKNHELFFQTVAELGRRDTPVRGLVVGAGEREDELRGLAERLLLADRTTWLGWRADLERIYPAVDALLLTSHDEGTPVAVIEALASGTRVLARDVGGVAEIFEGAGSGRLIPVGAAADRWADAVLEECAEPEPADAVRGHVLEQFSVARLAADLERLYRHEAGLA